ncbi:hypothetical protein Fmac_006011 [Flemingia macrophylla]|uniref:Uncharacterized protein n=1 Tax=Flemingia macrophylla TaxID=520843 RepID=A0ABD1N9E1_9FABA
MKSHHPSSAIDTRVWTNSVHGNVTSQLAYFRLRPSFPKVNWGTWIGANMKGWYLYRPRQEEKGEDR